MKKENSCCTIRISHISEILWFGEYNFVFSILPALEHLAQDRNESCPFLYFHACLPRPKKPLRLLAGMGSSSGELVCLEQDSLMFWHRYCGLTQMCFLQEHSLLQHLDPGAVWAGCWQPCIEWACNHQATEVLTHTQHQPRKGNGRQNWRQEFLGYSSAWAEMLSLAFPAEQVSLPTSAHQAASLLALLWFLALSWLMLCFQ